MNAATTVPEEWGTDAVLLQGSAQSRWLLFRRPLQVYAAHETASVLPLLRTVERHVERDGLFAAGFVAYEAAPAFDPALVVRPSGALPLAWFGVYAKPESFAFPPLSATGPDEIPWQASVGSDAYVAAIRKIRKYIETGDTYQVNYTYRLRAPFPEDPWPLFVNMIHAQQAHYGAFVTTKDWAIASASPEQFFRLDGSRLSSRPMKGTVARGLWHRDDLEKGAWLQQSEKNRAENVMIVDMVRNDLGRVAEVGTVQVPKLFEVEKYPTLWQMTSTVCCETRASVTDIFRALFPASSITGAPKPRTMGIIAELEDTPRQIYTGAIGFLAPGRQAQFNVAIRTVLVDRRRGQAEYGVGGGIVWDSEAGNELAECETKARILTQPPPRFSLLETMLWMPGDGYSLLDSHLGRLADSAAYFCRALDLEAVRLRLAALAGQLPAIPQRIRLLVSPEDEIVLEAGILKPLRQPYRVGLAKQPVQSSNRFLYHKITYRGVYDDALASAVGCDDVILWNERGEVTESCIANLIVELDGRRLTPPLACGLLPGLYRALLLERGEVQEHVIRLEDLPRCARIFLANSVRGLWEVTLIGERPHVTGDKAVDS